MIEAPVSPKRFLTRDKLACVLVLACVVGLGVAVVIVFVVDRSSSSSSSPASFFSSSSSSSTGVAGPTLAGYAQSSLGFWPSVGASTSFAIHTTVFNSAISSAYAVYADSAAGSDGNSGTSTHPVQSIQRAQQVAQWLLTQTTQQVAVFLNGVFYLNATWQLGALDSPGTSTQYMTYTSLNPSTPAVISGGVPLPGSGWTLYNSGLNIYQMNIGSSLAATLPRNIWINGQRIPPARSVNWPYLSTLVSTTVNTFSCSACSLPTLTTTINAEIHMIITFMHYICQATISPSYLVTLDMSCWQTAIYALHDAGTTTLYVAWIQNSLPLLVSPGYWYGPDANSMIYFIPPNNAWLSYPVIVPALQTTITLNSVTNVAFWNVQFSHSNWQQPSTSTGFTLNQADVYFLNSGAAVGFIPPSVYCKGCTNTVVAKSTFTQLGNTAIHYDTPGANNIFWSNTLTDVSASGIRVGNYVYTAGQKITHTAVQDNTIFNIAAEYKGSVAIFQLSADFSSIDHNLLYDISYTGISVGLGGSMTNPAQPVNNTIAYNQIHDYCQWCTDCGGIYVNDETFGETISNNYIYNQVNSPFVTTINPYTNSQAIYIDNGSTDILVTNDNVIRNISKLNDGEGSSLEINAGTGPITFCCGGNGSPFSSTCASEFPLNPNPYLFINPFAISSGNQALVQSWAVPRTNLQAVNPAPLNPLTC